MESLVLHMVSTLRNFALLALLTCISVSIFGQKTNLMLQSHLKEARSGDMVSLVLRGDVPKITQAVAQNGGSITLETGQMVAIRIPAAQVENILRNPAVSFVEFSTSKGQPLNDLMLENNNVIPIHEGVSTLGASYKGEDVVMGIIDSGIELDHPDFQDENGNTRVKFLWDQTQSGDPNRIPEEYGYGQEWTFEDIDAGICPHEDQQNYYGHGSTVTGTAAGNGNATGQFTGVAPESDLIIVSSDFNRENWKLSVAESVEYIFNKADLLGKPCVVNISLGDYYGSHDGRDAAAQFIDSLITAQPGRAVVSACGNSGSLPPYHLSYDVSPNDTLFTLFDYHSSTVLGYGAVFFELWADTADFNNVQYAIGADKTSPTYEHQALGTFRNIEENLDTILVDTLEYNGLELGIVRTWAGLRGGEYLLQVEVTQPFSSQYKFRLSTVGEGTFDVWSTHTFSTSNMVINPNSISGFNQFNRYRAPDNLKSIVSSWNCSSEVISVGNYQNRVSYTDVNGNTATVPGTVGEISVNSSRGPTRDNRTKPDLAATGDITLSAGKLSQLEWLINNEPFKVAEGGWHYRNGGTSMASPVVAGTAALYFSRCPNASNEQLREHIIGTAYQDSFTGATPSNEWGNGKLDAYSALLQPNQEVNILLDGNPEFCEGDSISLAGTPGFESYEWSNDETGEQIFADQGGLISLVASDESGCQNIAEPISVQELPAPGIPVIELMDDTLFAEVINAEDYQWYLNGNAIGGGEEGALPAVQEGSYTVEAISAGGCTTESEAFSLDFSSNGTSLKTEAVLLYPNPTSERIVLELNSIQAFELRIFSTSGRMVLNRNFEHSTSRNSIDIGHLAGGTYIVEIRGSNLLERMPLLIAR